MKRLAIIILLLSVLLMFFLGEKLIFANTTIPTICYDGIQKEISFINDNNTDLFSDLKEIMPGDIKEQNILFKLRNVKKETKIFLKIDGNPENELPKNISIRVLKDNQELSKKGEYIELGTFSENKEINLKVVVEVPKEVGNKIEDISQHIEWKFFVQEGSENISTDNTSNNYTNNTEEMDFDSLIELPYTYDNINLILNILICILSLIVIVCLIVVFTKRKISKFSKKCNH